MKGSGIPVAGTKELATDMFVKAWKQIEKVMPIASSFPNISGHFLAIMKPLCKNTPNKQTKKKHPKKPNSSPMIAKIKSVCPSGSQESFCLEFPKPTPKKPPEEKATID